MLRGRSTRVCGDARGRTDGARGAVESTGVTAFRNTAVLGVRVMDYRVARVGLDEGLRYADEIEQSYCRHVMGSISAMSCGPKAAGTRPAPPPRSSSWSRAASGAPCRARRARRSWPSAEASWTGRGSCSTVARRRPRERRARTSSCPHDGVSRRPRSLGGDPDRRPRVVPRGRSSSPRRLGNERCSYRSSSPARGRRSRPAGPTMPSAGGPRRRPARRLARAGPPGARSRGRTAPDERRLHGGGPPGRSRRRSPAGTRSGGPGRRLWARLDLAACHLRANRDAEAVTLIRGVADRADALGSRPLRDRADDLLAIARGRGAEEEPWRPLTAREFEVARLVAEGMTNAAIGERARALAADRRRPRGAHPRQARVHPARGDRGVGGRMRVAASQRADRPPLTARASGTRRSRRSAEEPRTAASIVRNGRAPALAGLSGCRRSRGSCPIGDQHHVANRLGIWPHDCAWPGSPRVGSSPRDRGPRRW